MGRLFSNLALGAVWDVADFVRSVALPICHSGTWRREGGLGCPALVVLSFQSCVFLKAKEDLVQVRSS